MCTVFNRHSIQDSDTVPCMWYYEQIIHHSADISLFMICKYINKRSCYATSLFIKLLYQTLYKHSEKIPIIGCYKKRYRKTLSIQILKAEVNWQHRWFKLKNNFDLVCKACCMFPTEIICFCLNWAFNSCWIMTEKVVLVFQSSCTFFLEKSKNKICLLKVSCLFIYTQTL